YPSFVLGRELTDGPAAPFLDFLSRLPQEVAQMREDDNFRRRLAVRGSPNELIGHKTHGGGLSGTGRGDEKGSACVLEVTNDRVPGRVLIFFGLAHHVTSRAHRFT